jgi:DNA-directed RNA polymerase specialized sigma24 family protein
MELMEIYDQYYDRLNRFIRSLVKDNWAADDLDPGDIFKGAQQP